MYGSLLQQIKNNVYENKLISKGSNYPSINISLDHFNTFCVLLHRRVSLNDIREVMPEVGSSLERKLDDLILEGLLKRVGSIPLPSFPVISIEEGEIFKQLSWNAGKEIVELIIAHQDQIVAETFKIGAFQSFSFEELSFFILSDVLLDCIQIDNVEEIFLKTGRPVRNQKAYYYSIMEKDKPSNQEAFGIYGNSCQDMGEYSLCMYGNNRCNNIQKETASLPILDNSDYLELYQIAEVIKDDLIDILISYREVLHKAYSTSLYAKETSFEEYFIWYYHFLYSYVTDELIRMKIIQKPHNGIFSYVIEQ